LLRHSRRSRSHWRRRAGAESGVERQSRALRLRRGIEVTFGEQGQGDRRRLPCWAITRCAYVCLLVVCERTSRVCIHRPGCCHT
jgi:hypothetical protein